MTRSHVLLHCPGLRAARDEAWKAKPTSTFLPSLINRPRLNAPANQLEVLWRLESSEAGDEVSRLGMHTPKR
jgi:hypothetical protein